MKLSTATYKIFSGITTALDLTLIALEYSVLTNSNEPYEEKVAWMFLFPLLLIPFTFYTKRMSFLIIVIFLTFLDQWVTSIIIWASSDDKYYGGTFFFVSIFSFLSNLLVKPNIKRYSDEPSATEIEKMNESEGSHLGDHKNVLKVDVEEVGNLGKKEID